MTSKELDQLFTTLNSKDNTLRYEAFKKLLAETENKVTWIYIKWDELVEKISSENSFQRSIGLMLLANLVKSDSDKRFPKILAEYLEHLDDEKFITARQCIQSVWKIAIEDKTYNKKILASLEQTYYENFHNKTHANLIKQDVISALKEIYKHTNDKKITVKVSALIEEENDIKLKAQLKKTLAA